MTVADAAILAERTERTKKLKELLGGVRALPPDELSAFLARRRVERGFNWLARHAPNQGWWRNCFRLGGSSRIQMKYSEDSVVTLAFEYEPEFADESGYVQDWKVLKHFFGPLWAIRGRRLGFGSVFPHGHVPFPKKYPGVVVTDDLLTRLWQEKLSNVPVGWQIQFRHRTALDRRFAALDLGPPKGRMRRFLAGVPWVGKLA